MARGVSSELVYSNPIRNAVVHSDRSGQSFSWLAKRALAAKRRNILDFRASLVRSNPTLPTSNRSSHNHITISEWPNHLEPGFFRHSTLSRASTYSRRTSLPMLRHNLPLAALLFYGRQCRLQCRPGHTTSAMLLLHHKTSDAHRQQSELSRAGRARRLAETLAHHLFCGGEEASQTWCGRCGAEGGTGVHKKAGRRASGGLSGGGLGGEVVRRTCRRTGRCRC